MGFFKYFSLIFILLIFSTYTPYYQNERDSFFFPIKKIEVEKNLIVDSKKLKNELRYLIGNSIFFINKDKVNLTIKKFEFIKGYKIKKVYPNKLKFIINENQPVAVYFDKNSTYFLTEDGKKITYYNISGFDNLPSVIGNNKNFVAFYQDLKSKNFNMSQIASFQHFDLGRWDVVLKNKKIIKLPSDNYIEAIENFLLLENKNNFEKYQIFDYRIKDQLILK